jgi:transmembrane sensor
VSHVHDGGDRPLSPDILRQAAAWFASLADASAGEAERQSWREWLEAHPDHMRAWRRVEAVMGRLVPLADSAGAAGAALATTRRRRKMLGALGALLLAGGGAAVLQMPWRQWRDEAAMARADYRAGMGKVSTAALRDGSRIWLGSLGVLGFDYDDRLRRLRLFRGDLLVETGADPVAPPRPFVVDTPQGRLRALGTRFAVRALDATSRVDVFEGAVEITPRDLDSPVHVVHAGAHAVFDRASLHTVGQASPAREAWSRGILAADRMRLDDLAEELGRWHPVRIVCDAKVAGLRVVGTYPLQDLDRILAALSTSLPVDVVREGNTIRLNAGVARPATAATWDSPPSRIE